MLSASTAWIDWSALWKICVIGVLLGAGLPALVAIGLRALSLPAHGSSGPRSADDEQIYHGNVLGAVIAVVCFGIVLASVGVGIYWIVSS